MQTNLRHILSCCVFLLIFGGFCEAQITDPILKQSIEEQRDSIRKRRDSIRKASYYQLNDSTGLNAKSAKARSNSEALKRKAVQDSILNIKLKRRQDSLDRIEKLKVAAENNKVESDSILKVKLKIRQDSLDNIERNKRLLEQEKTEKERLETQLKRRQDSLRIAEEEKEEKIEITPKEPVTDTLEEEVVPLEPTVPIIPNDETIPTISQEEEQRIEELRDGELDTEITPDVSEGIPLVQQDSIVNDSVQPSGMLTDIVTYKSKDYMRLARKENKMYLYNEAEVLYEDMIIKAGLIVIDNVKNEVYAYGIKDSLGDYVQSPVFTQANSVVEPDSIRFNFDTERALVYNSRTEEGGFKVKGEVTKRQNDSVYYMKNVKFTTSDDIENPDYFFYARRIKFVPDKKIVTGLVNMHIADVPTPLGLPFGYFPLTEDRTSGFIIPSYGEDNQRGFSLQNGGYYFAISDYIDLAATGSYFTNGSYTLQFQSTYAKRYRYRGNASFRSEKLINSERGFPDFSESSNYNIQWSHQQDAKANPSSQFRASVNLGSSRFFQQSINQQNLGSNLVNNYSSSISYSKVFTGDPEFNFTVAATHNQNTGTEEVNVTLPSLQAGVSRIYPFKPANGAPRGALQNINLSYNLRAENRYSTTEEEFFTSEMFADGIYGAQHSIPVSTNFKLLNYLSASVGGNYTENWVFKTFERSYDNDNREVVVDTLNGFDSYRTYNASASLGTSIYGLFNISKSGKLQKIRHVMRPSISYNINPGFSQFYDQYVIPGIDETEEDEVVSYTRFQGTLFGAPTENLSSSIGFSLNNVFEAKVRDKDSTATQPKKIVLLNNLNFRTSYNLTADSLQLAPIAVSGTLPLFKEKLSINFNGALDIYALDNNNRRVNTLNINNGGSLFRLTSGNVSFGYNFSSDQFNGGKPDNDRLDNQTLQNGGRADDLFGKPIGSDGNIYDEDETDDEPEEDNTDRYNYKIPWQLRLAYTLNYTNSARQDMISSQSISISSDIELSPKWKVGGSTSINIQEQTFNNTSFRFQRDLGSFRMSFNWSPFRTNAPWNFFIGIKSNVLQDIKYEQRRRPDQTL